MIISEVLERVSEAPVVEDPGHFALEPFGMSGKMNL